MEEDDKPISMGAPTAYWGRLFGFTHAARGLCFPGARAANTKRENQGGATKRDKRWYIGRVQSKNRPARAKGLGSTVLSKKK